MKTLYTIIALIALSGCTIKVVSIDEAWKQEATTAINNQAKVDKAHSATIASIASKLPKVKKK